jgi:hypothetical protein
MPAFSIHARVDQIVTKDVILLIEAGNEEEAKDKAKTVLETYPAPGPYDPMVHRVVTKKSHYWIPKSIDFVEIQEEQNEEA